MRVTAVQRADLQASSIGFGAKDCRPDGSQDIHSLDTQKPRAACVGWNEIANPGSDEPKTVWVKARPDALEPIAPHEGRHSAAST
jgi:hypothetical protein